MLCVTLSWQVYLSIKYTVGVDHFIVKCLTCGAMWDNDFDPPGCQDPDHNHYLEVLSVEKEVDSKHEPGTWTGDLSA